MIYLIGALAFVALEWKIKSRVEEKNCSLNLWHGRIWIHPCRNYGLIFGLFQNVKHLAAIVQCGVLLIFSIICIPVLFMKRFRYGLKLGSALLLGGALGNVADRLFRGYVVDYIRFPKVRFKKFARLVFNLADFLILAGSVLMAIFALAGEKK